MVGADLLLHFLNSQGQAVLADVLMCPKTTGQIDTITLWVCEHTCQQLERWRFGWLSTFPPLRSGCPISSAAGT